MINHILNFLKDIFYLKYLPQLGDNASYGLIFLFGLLTSFHCIGMCGGIVLTQCINKNITKEENKSFFHMSVPIVYYNFGRLISYSVIGGIVGGVGEVLTFSGFLKGVIPIFAGVFMILMSINLLGFFPILRYINIAMPKFIIKKIRSNDSKRNPLIIGLLTGLMPCGPMQMIQLYALSTRSVIYGALAAFVFTVGTIPGVSTFGVFSNIISKKYSKGIQKASAVLVAVLGFAMISRGLVLTGISLPSELTFNNKTNGYAVAVVKENIQNVTTSISEDSFPAIQVKRGIKVIWTIKVDKSVYNDCNSEIQIPEYNIDKKFSIGDNIIEFTPDKDGVFAYGCWMGMIKSKIKVVEN